MNSLPQLRTVWTGPSPPPPEIARAAAPVAVEHPKLPAAAQQLLGEALHAGLMTSAEVAVFVSRVGDRIGQLTTREFAANALVHFEFLTPYQKLRLASGQTHGMILGNYRVLDRLGGGTVGTVFTAVHPFLKRKVAVKVLTFEGEKHSDAVERFLDEARILARLNHPHVVAVLDAGTTKAEGRDGSLWYTVLELVDGGDVEHFVYDHGAQPLPLACEWGRQIALGLRAIHDAGIVHRDLKPGNLLLTESHAIKIADFGLARQPTSTRTPCQTLLGSLEFLAPEQLQDPTTVGPAADIYALGVTLFWTLTGKLPYPEGLGLKELGDFILKATPRRLREVRTGLPSELDETITRMLNRNPAHRPTADEVARYLETLSTGHGIEPGTDPAPSHEINRIRQLEAQAAQSVIALAAKSAQLAEAHAAFLSMLADTIAKRPGESVGHQRRISAYVQRLSRALAKSPRWVSLADPKAQSEFASVARVHDLGLVDVPDAAILAEVGQRTPSEEYEYETHPIRGDAILEDLAARHGDGLPFLRTLRAVVRHHHEHWDGTGFPDRLAGESIPLAARIVCLADGYDTLRSAGRTHIDAINKLDKSSGTFFDPSLLQQLRSCHHDWDAIFAVIPDSGATEVIALAAVH